MSIDEIIARLEEGMEPSAGTTISRQLDPDGDGMRWCVAVGPMMLPKNFYYGYTIREALENALEQEEKLRRPRPKPTLTKEELERRFKENYRIEGFGLDMTIHSPCPFCGAADFLTYKFWKFSQELTKETVCRDCGRGLLGIIKRAQGSIILEVEQTRGDDAPPYIPIPKRHNLGDD
jgi:hypothetical protein